MDKEKNIERFESELSKVKRPGIENLIEFIRTSDFYTAPTSTQYHLSVEGGLLQHSLNVLDVLKGMLRDNKDGTYSYVIAGKTVQTINEEMLVIITLLHDMCKVFFYGTEKRNRKNNETGALESYNAYKVENALPIGHGSKSVIMIMKYIQLTDIEILAITHHMGMPDDSVGKNEFGNAVEMAPIVWALHSADMMASRIVEGKEQNKPLFESD